MKKLRMRYFSPAPNDDQGWEKYSLPLGNGYFGASLFGGAETERIQFATNEFANDYARGGVSNFAEILIHFSSTSVSHYQRELNLNEALATSSYLDGGVAITKEAFASYPDRLFAYRIRSDKPIDFSIELLIPFLGARSLEEGGRTGELIAEDSAILMRGTLPFRHLIYEAKLFVESQGQVTSQGKSLKVAGSRDTVLLFALATSYKLTPEMFFDGNHQALGPDPHELVSSLISHGASQGYEALRERHIKDFNALMGRVDFDLGGLDEGRSTEELLNDYRKGKKVPYFEELYFSYGRYLLISSSRKGTLPASLQGVWNVHDKSPWGSGYWHNINLQMNYWPAFSTNLDETFLAYADFEKAYQRQGEINASGIIKENYPENYLPKPGECGWTIGTGAYAYEIENPDHLGHSGPGTGGMTSQLFCDYYDFSKSPEALEDYVYPAIHGMAKYMSKCQRKYGDRYLCPLSASPEQSLCGHWTTGDKKQQYYHTVGCSFDQQFARQNAENDLRLSSILGRKDPTTLLEKKQLKHYDAVRVGYSGQIKEYDEEHFYGEIGEAQHRHISQLVGLMPGNLINHQTPAWLDAAKITLELRGDKSTGWALAHRLNAWARIGDGEHAYLLLHNLLAQKTYPNLWDVHPPFQIDGNFGGTSGIAEMLIQSHEGYINLLPALPKTWREVAFRGLKARGDFVISLIYRQNRIQSVSLVSPRGGAVLLKAPGLNRKILLEEESTGKPIAHSLKKGRLAFQSESGKTYRIAGFQEALSFLEAKKATGRYTAKGVQLSFGGPEGEYAIYRAQDSEAHYRYLGSTSSHRFLDPDFSSSRKGRITYKIVDAANPDKEKASGALVVLDPASRLEKERYRLRLETNNLNSVSLY